MLFDIHTQDFSNKGKTKTNDSIFPTVDQVLGEGIICEVSHKLKHRATITKHNIPKISLLELQSSYSRDQGKLLLEAKDLLVIDGSTSNKRK